MPTAKEIIEAGKDWGVLCVDVESSGYSPGHKHGYLRTVQFGVPDAAWYFVHGEDDPALISAVLEQSPHLTAHNAGFDNRWLAHVGYANLRDLWLKTSDTFIMHQLLHPDADKNDLKTLGATYADGESKAALVELKKVFTRNKWLINTKDTTPIERSGWAQIPIDNETYVRYALSDVYDGSKLALALLPLMNG